jgi:polyisoprenoid-binding protein YceI
MRNFVLTKDANEMNINITFRVLTAVLLVSLGLSAQTYTLENEVSSLLIEGTSNIHDWTIEAENCSGTLTAEFDESKLEDISNLELNVIARSLMSGRSGMDKNTNKALNTDKYKEITYRHKKLNSIEKQSGNTYKIKTTGSLMIAGKAKDINLVLNLEQVANRLVLKGEYQLNMTDYGVEAPTAMFGTIKTGEEVVVKFEIHFNKYPQP